MTASEPLPVVERTGVALLAPADVRRAEWALEALGALDAPASLAPLLRWEAGAVSLLLVHALPAGAVALEEVLARGPLDLPHAVTVAVAVGEALVALHDAGLAHGAVDGEHVVVAPDGAVLLAGTGLAWRGVPGTPEGPRAPDDVAAFGALLRGLLGPRSAPAPLVVAALRATDADPALRPTAAEVVSAVRRCAHPEPLPVGAASARPVAATPRAEAPRAEAPRPGVPARPSRHPGGGAERPTAAREPSSDATTTGGRRTRSVRRVVVVLLLVVAGSLAVRAVPVRPADASAAAEASSSAAAAPVAAASAAATPTDPARPASASPAAVDWRGVLASLDEGRRRALGSGSEAELALWVDPDGSSWARDRALQQRLASSGSTLTGGALVLEEVVAQEVGADRVVLAVRDRRTAYDVVQDGRATRVPERPARWWTVVLTALPSLDGDGWRVADVRGATDRAVP